MAVGRMLKKRISMSKKLADLSSDTVRLLYTWMLSHLDVEGRFSADPYVIKGLVFPRVKTITPDIIAECIAELDESGLIVIYYDNGDSYLEYRKFHHFQNIKKEREARSEYPSLEDCQDKNKTTPDQIRSRSGSVQAQDKIREEKLSKDMRKSKRTFAYPSDFVKFWESYPKKRSKGDALKAWKAEKIDTDLLQTILSALEVAKRSKKWLEKGGEFIPHPATWIRATGWEDEYEDDGKNLVERMLGK